MQKFLKKILFTCLFCIVFFAINYGVNSFLIHQDNFTTKPNVNTLIVGDSHLQSGLDDEILENSVNVCKGAENYYITYHKLIYLLKHNKNINQIILGFSFHNFTKFNDFKFKNKPSKLSILTAYVTLLDYTGIKEEFPIDNKVYLQAFYRNYLLPNTFYYKNLFTEDNKKYPFNGLSHKSNKSVVNDTLLLLNQSKTLFNYNNKDSTLLSENSLKYFEKIIELLEERKIKTVLISTPLHHKMIEKIPQEVNVFFNNLKSKNKLRKNLLTLDYTNLKMDDSDFGDFHHLNKTGSVKFSNLIKKELSDVSSSLKPY